MEKINLTKCKIDGKTLDYKNPNKSWHKPVRGNQVNSLAEVFANDKEYNTCPIDEFYQMKNW